MSDLISRSALLEKFNDIGVQITFDLPVEEILGTDVDMDDFSMLVQDAIQAYRKMVLGVIQEQPTTYDTEKVEQQIKEYSHGHFGCNSNGEHKKCDGCGMAPTCKEKYKHWFGAQDKKDGWIPCSERLPEEHDSIFAKRKGTDKWDDAMFEKTSDVVNVTVVDKDGKGVTTHARTVDGKWSCDLLRCNKSYRIIAWQPLPAPYRPDENIEQNQMQSSAWKEHMMGRFMKGE